MRTSSWTTWWTKIEYPSTVDALQWDPTQSSASVPRPRAVRIEVDLDGYNPLLPRLRTFPWLGPSRRPASTFSARSGLERKNLEQQQVFALW